MFAAVLLLYLGTRWPTDDARSNSPTPVMPGALSQDEQESLYLTPGGLYSEADIRANGRQTAAQAFTGFQAEHDFSPERGDRLCPITRTKANPKCCWVINGRSYCFCCPPCVDEFVRLAKNQPDAIGLPDDYVK